MLSDLDRFIADQPEYFRVACLIDESNDMEAHAAAYNRWYAKANPRPLAADGSAYHLRSLARKRRSR